ncbi:MAG: DNA primase [Epsilonproteobacteria bacterium]|nr:MAG: DNA primase [Campylobacterota bacterium]RLA65335.1 MAG: DNA primase [Campylobacterota bacterium]
MALSDLKDLIKDTPISQVIGSYIKLTVRGNHIQGLCPFHPDTKPSLIVNDQKKLFMCFACQTGGDAITFVQKFKGVGFVDALKELAQVVGVQFSQYEEEKKKNPKREMARKILSRAVKIYRKTKPSPVYQEFLKKRNLDPQTCDTFSLGLAPNNSIISGYLNSLPEGEEKKLALDVAQEIGLIKKDRTYYDTFRDRIIFPIWDRFGHLQGFTSRALFAHQKAKYMNSVGSFIFDKKNLLYGFHLAKTPISQKDAVIVCEGNMDLIALHKFGFDNSIAIMGLALGEQSQNVLKNLTSNIYLGLDNDDAGLMAAERINHGLMLSGIIPKYLDFSPHKDPDEFLESEGALKLQELIDTAPALVDILIDKSMPESIPTLMDKKLTLLKSAFAILAPLGNNLEASERLAFLAKRLGLKSDPLQINQAFEEYLKDHPADRERHSITQIQTPKEFPKPNLQKTEQSLGHGEKLFIQEIIQNPEYLTHGKVSEMLDLVKQTDVSLLVSRLRKIYFEVDESEFPQIVMSLINSGELSLPLREVAGAALYRYKPMETTDEIKSQVFEDIKAKILVDRLMEQKKMLKLEIDDCSDEKNLDPLMQKLLGIEKDLKKLKTLKLS